MKKKSWFFLLLLFILPGLTFCKKEEDLVIPLFTPAGTVTDIDSNTYNAIQIGSQIWMAENLKTTRFRNGAKLIDANADPLAVIYNLDNVGAFYNYNHDEMVNTYGLLYNWFTVNDVRNIAPKGWHVPSSAEWDTLIQNIGGLKNSAIKLKDIDGWKSGGNGTNISGFTALPGGMVLFTPAILLDYNEDYGYWWCSDYDSTALAFAVKISFDKADLVKSGNYFKNTGLSIRCVKDN